MEISEQNKIDSDTNQKFDKKTVVISNVMLGGGGTVFWMVAVLLFLLALNCIEGKAFYFLGFICFFFSYLILVIFVVGTFTTIYSSLPFWSLLHRLFFMKWSGRDAPVAADTVDGSMEDSPKRMTFLSGKLLVCVFPFMFAAVNFLIVCSQVKEYYDLEVTGRVIEKREYRQRVTMADGQEFNSPVDIHGRFSNLKHLEVGDVVEKKRGFGEMAVNGKTFFNERMVWEQTWHMPYVTFIFIGVAVGLLIPTIYKICRPDELIVLVGQEPR